jgi:hypothetical protein
VDHIAGSLGNTAPAPGPSRRQRFPGTGPPPSPGGSAGSRRARPGRLSRASGTAASLARHRLQALRDRRERPGDQRVQQAARIVGQRVPLELADLGEVEQRALDQTQQLLMVDPLGTPRSSVSTPDNAPDASRNNAMRAATPSAEWSGSRWSCRGRRPPRRVRGRRREARR